MKTYEVTVDGWADGTYRRAGEKVEMPEASAKWLVMNGQLREAAPSPAPADAPARSRRIPRAAAKPEA